MPFNKPFKIKYRKNKQSYFGQDQPTNTTDHKSKLMEGDFTSCVIEWFHNFQNKERLSFKVFDIESFCPSSNLEFVY